MKTKQRTFLTGAALATIIMTGQLAGYAQEGSIQFPIPTTAAEVPGPPPGTAMTKAYVSRGGGKAKSH